ncbi:MAG: 6-phosphogluconolactonase [Polyangiaceae bacterium]
MAELAAREIGEMLRAAVRARGSASLSLAGGTTPRAAYQLLANEAVPWPQVSIYFGDERCVSAEDPDSNYHMAREALFSRLAQQPASIARMVGESSDYDAAAREYEGVLPDTLDVLVLGLGEDGHTASLFPGSAALHEVARRVLPVIGPKPPPQRLTITPPVLKAARQVVVLAAGAGKATAMARALEGDVDIERCPAQLVRDALWLMDHAAAAELSGKW